LSDETGENMKKACFVVLFFFSATFFSSAYMPSARAQGQAIIMPNHTGYLDNTTIPITYHVVGEVSNIGTANLNLLNATASFYAQDNSLIGSSSSYAFLDVLLPSRKAPFEVVWVGASAKQIQNYSLNLRFDDYVLEKSLALQILENTVYEDEAGFTKVNGTVKNLGKSNATAVKVATTFYDTQNRVMSVGRDYTFPSTIMPGNTESFELELGSKIGSFSNYSLAAESVEYVSIGEGMTIDYGASYTTSTSVTLVSLPDGLQSSTAQMQFSNDNMTFTDWEPYTPSRAWLLEGGEGVKTVYAQFMDGLGSVSYYYDTIILDTVPPTISVVSPFNASVVKSSTLTVTWEGHDTTSGVIDYEIKLDNDSWVDVRANTTRKFENLTSGNHTVSIKAIDNAGLSSQGTASFEVDLSTSSAPINLQGIAFLATLAIVLAVTIIYFSKIRRSRHSRGVQKSHRR